MTLPTYKTITFKFNCEAAHMESTHSGEIEMEAEVVNVMSMIPSICDELDKEELEGLIEELQERLEEKNN